MNSRFYFVYILSNETGTLYVGVTNNLKRRCYEHKVKLIKGFTSQYDVHRLVYYECFQEVRFAIQREKQIKGWSRRKKLEAVRKLNPEAIDLYDSI
ncbi:MAG TPA: GIY-YIG nuclease family protein [bacterium]|nr:GIY-YIG nuclease family protein [bacterium]